MPTSTWKPRDERQYRAIVKSCRSDLKTCKHIAAATVNKRRARGLSGLSSLGRAEYMLTRGFKDGNKSWIDVMPARGPKMRVTHEILEGLEGVGSSMALMWTAAGAVALLVLSDAQRARLTGRPALTPEQQATLDRLNRARLTQGLAPLPG